ncbi:MAG: TIGR02646 family protein [Magnetococcales bacterium]|nr:TIGR02646 family protein [Magnetococcales bacterium]
MRHIQKGPPPGQLVQWRQEGLVFDFLPDRRLLREKLLAEQHRLCAYTMRRIGSDNSHIEHIVPQSQDPERALDWNNMVACDESSHYGAHYKKDERVFLSGEANFLSPLNPSCESRLQYHRDGQVAGTDDVADKTIRRLNLNHTDLQTDRRVAFETAGLVPKRGSRPGKPLMKTPLEARRFAQKVIDPNQGELPPFCQALFQVAGQRAAQGGV